MGPQDGTRLLLSIRIGLVDLVLINVAQSPLSKRRGLSAEAAVFLKTGYGGLNLNYLLVSQASLQFSLRTLFGIGTTGYRANDQSHFDFRT